MVKFARLKLGSVLNQEKSFTISEVLCIARDQLNIWYLFDLHRFGYTGALNPRDWRGAILYTSPDFDDTIDIWDNYYWLPKELVQLIDEDNLSNADFLFLLENSL